MLLIININYLFTKKMKIILSHKLQNVINKDVENNLVIYNNNALPKLTNFFALLRACF